MRFLKEISPQLWQTDTRNPESAYGTAFFHDSPISPRVFVPPDCIPKLYLRIRTGPVEKYDRLQAQDIELVSRF
jgi:hypothetical protein